MQRFFEKGMTGVFSYISKRYSKTNNNYLKCYDPKQESNHSINLEENSLHCYTMSKFFFRTSEFKWIDPKNFDSNKYRINSSTGCVLEVDLENSKELCKLHNDYPLTPDKIAIKNQLMISDFYSTPIGNWCLTFSIKKYVLHYENLQLHLRLGLTLKKYIVY